MVIRNNAQFNTRPSLKYMIQTRLIICGTEFDEDPSSYLYLDGYVLH